MKIKLIDGVSLDDILNNMKKEMSQNNYVDLGKYYGVLDGIFWYDNGSGILSVGKGLEYNFYGNMADLIKLIDENKKDIEKELDKAKKWLDIGNKLKKEIKKNKDTLIEYDICGVEIMLDPCNGEYCGVVLKFTDELFGGESDLGTALYCYLGEMKINDESNMSNEALFEVIDRLVAKGEVEKYKEWKKIYNLFDGMGIFNSGWGTSFKRTGDGLQFEKGDLYEENISKIKPIVNKDGTIKFDNIEELETMLEFLKTV